jgi:hypothetical protein
LAAELFSILQEVSQMTPSGEAGERRTEAMQLPSGLVARSVALSRAATRYWTAEVPDRTSSEVPVPRFADRPRSPERGQLLAGMIAAGVDIPALAEAGTTFVDADLREAILQDANLRGAKLRGADLNQANLRSANLVGADLSHTNLGYANLSAAILRGADLSYAYLPSANLMGANLSGADLRAYLREASLIGADLSGARLGGADLRDAYVGVVRPGQLLPEGFPKGWSAPPDGWELFEDGGMARLRRLSAPRAGSDGSCFITCYGSICVFSCNSRPAD